VTQLCDRKINLSKSQDGFLAFVAQPLFEVFGKFLTKYISQECSEKYNQGCLSNIQKNREYWQLQIEKGEEGNKEFMEETDPALKNFKLHLHDIRSLLDLPSHIAD